MSNRFDACFVTWQTINTDKKLTGKQVHINCKQSIQITLHSAEWWQMNIQRLQDVVSFFQRQTLEHAHHRLQQTHYVSYAQCTIVVTSVQLRRVTLQFNNKIRPKTFCCFWSNTREFTPIVCSWSITDTDSVLCTSEDCVNSAEHTKH